MKKRIIFLLIAVLAVSFSSIGSTAPKFLKKAKEKVTGKEDKKKAPAVVAANAVLAKGLSISWCGDDVTDNGSITFEALKNGVAIPVKNGKFDIVLPLNPVFSSDEQELYYAKRGDVEYDFGSAKIYTLNAVNFGNTSPEPRYVMGRKAEGRGNLGFDLYYSDSDVTGTIQGESVTLKKGWNIVGDKTDLSALLMCAG
jgi:hypothetical protein